MIKLCFQYWAINYNENFSQYNKNFAQLVSRFCPIQNKPSKNSQICLKFGQSGEILPNLVILLSFLILVHNASHLIYEPQTHSHINLETHILCWLVGTLSLSLYLCIRHILSSMQCDQIGRFWKFSSTNFHTKVAQKFRDFGLQCKTTEATFWTTFKINLDYFHSTIWSHWQLHARAALWWNKLKTCVLEVVIVGNRFSGPPCCTNSNSLTPKQFWFDSPVAGSAALAAAAARGSVTCPVHFWS